MRAADYEAEFQDTSDPYLRAEWVGWSASPPDSVPLSDIAIDGTTAVAWGERGGVLYILDVYEVESSGAEPVIPLRTFRPIHDQQPNRMGYSIFIVLALLVLVGWLLGSIYYLTIGRLHP